jgi:hypothetical protein
VGGDGVTASWWVGSSPVVQRCEGLRVYHDGGGVTALRGIIVYFVLILIFCNLLKLLMCQLMRGWQKTLVFCDLRIAAALNLK